MSGVRVIVMFTEKEVEMLDRSVEKLNREPGDRTTRSDVVRVGALHRAATVLGLPHDPTIQPVDVPESAAAEGGE